MQLLIEQGVDTFDCVSPTRVARNGAFYTFDGRKNMRASKYREDFSPLLEDCDCYACKHYTKAYLQHLFRSKESLAGIIQGKALIKRYINVQKGIKA